MPRRYSFVEDGKIDYRLFSRWALHHKLLLLLITMVIVILCRSFWLTSPEEETPATVPSLDVKLEVAGMPKKGLTTQDGKFYLDGHSFQILSGSIHYFRVPRAYWRDRLLKLKAAGLNTVDTYVAWNLHEERRGQFDFSGELDLVEFLSIARELGLYALLRPGPYICAEWEHGGLPAWLLSDPKMKVRTTYQGFTSAVEAYFSKLFSKVASLQYSKPEGGSIIAVQVENEYGGYSDDKKYLIWLKELLIRVGVVELLFTSDGFWDLERGSAPGVFVAANYNEKPEEVFDSLTRLQPNKPVMTAEFWCGWFDHWSEEHHTMKTDDVIDRLEPSFKRNASINFYMFHGGTNFGFMNGANLRFPGQKEETPKTAAYPDYLPTVTSYDYDSPLNEFGGKTAKYEKVRQLIKRYQTGQDSKAVVALDPWSKARAPVAYGQFNVSSALPLTNALDLLQPVPIDLERPSFVELIKADSTNQLHYGFVAYRTVITGRPGKITFQGVLADRMQVIVNGKTAATFQSNLCNAPFHEAIDLSIDKGTDADLVLLVENMGRANYVNRRRGLDGMFKGFNGTVTIEGPSGSAVLSRWRIYGIRFKTPADLQKLLSAASTKAQWRSADQIDSIDQPAFYRSELVISKIDGDHPDDTFINMKVGDKITEKYFKALSKDWTKGVVYANGVNLGRYWNVGPQQTLYVPGPWLRKDPKNEIVVFETGKPARSIKLQSEPILG